MKIHEEPISVIDDHGVRSKRDVVGLIFKILSLVIIGVMIILNVYAFLF